MKSLTSLCVAVLFATVFSFAKPIAHAKRTADCSVSLTSVKVMYPFHMVLTSSTGQRYTVGLSGPTSVPQGTYTTVVIVPTGGSNPSHSFHGDACSVLLTGSGTSVTWRGVVLDCSSAAFSVQ